MLTIVAKWDRTQVDPELEWRIWRQIKGAYAVDRMVFVPEVAHVSAISADQFATMADALATCQGQKVFLEPSGAENLEDVPAGDITLILGCTASGNLDCVQPGDMVCSIPSANPVDIYGVSAGAIATAYLYWAGKLV